MGEKQRKNNSQNYSANNSPLNYRSGTAGITLSAEEEELSRRLSGHGGHSE